MCPWIRVWKLAESQKFKPEAELIFFEEKSKAVRIKVKSRKQELYFFGFLPAFLFIDCYIYTLYCSVCWVCRWIIFWALILGQTIKFISKFLIRQARNQEKTLKAKSRQMNKFCGESLKSESRKLGFIFEVAS